MQKNAEYWLESPKLQESFSCFSFENIVASYWLFSIFVCWLTPYRFFSLCKLYPDVFRNLTPSLTSFNSCFKFVLLLQQGSNEGWEKKFTHFSVSDRYGAEEALWVSERHICAGWRSGGVCVSVLAPWGWDTAWPLPLAWWSACVLPAPCSDGLRLFSSWRRRASSAPCASTQQELMLRNR